MVLKVDATPRPSSCLFYHRGFPVNKREVYGELDPERVSYRMRVQFAEELVVYQAPILVGELAVRWDEELGRDELPDHVALEYDIYTLDGAHHEEVELSIMRWEA